jgi:aspartyl-tRNA(Asn)/glutamyl-tRNA(Gln) amidotransferase subunit A
VTEPYELGLAEALAAIRRRSLSPTELLEALLTRIEAVEPAVQALEAVDRAAAHAAARRSERAAARGSSPPLLGIPFGVKDIFFTRDLPTGADFPGLVAETPRDDAAAVARLRRAGAVVLGKTVTTQFAFVDPPRTRNPWHPERTPGGSSSGSAAAVAARMVPLALGSQTAGSVLRPAAYCGVVGLKPSAGRISRFGVLPLAPSLDQVGLIVRSVEDAALALGPLTGFDGRDPASTRRPHADYSAAARAPDRPPRLGLLTDFLDRATPEVVTHMRAVAADLATSGAAIEETRLPAPVALYLAVHHLIMQSEVAAIHAARHAAQTDAYAPRLRAYIETGALIPAPVYLHAQRLRERLQPGVLALLGKFDAFLLPTVSNLAPFRDTTGDPSFQAIWTLFGLPALTLPSGLSPDGLPFALQLVAPPFAEAPLLASAAWCERALGAPVGAPPFPG